MNNAVKLPDDPSDGPGGHRLPEDATPPVRSIDRVRARRRWLLAGTTLCALLALGVVAAITLNTGWVGPTQPPPTEPIARLERPRRPAEDYVGSKVCAECHAKVSDKYARHPMAKSMTAMTDMTDMTPIEDYVGPSRFSPTSAREYWVERRDQQVFHHEIGKSDTGEVLFDESVPILYAMGSGQRGRSYMLFRDGYLHMSPISWYSTEKRWDLSPGYAVEDHPRFERPATDRCLQCHVGRVRYAQSPTTELSLRYADPPFQELSIGCERCHGPGGKHVEFRRERRERTPTADGVTQVDPIVNPSRLEPSRRDAVCNQCHLQGETIVLRYGRLHGDFRPGQDLGDIWSIFVRDARVNGEQETRAVSQVEQMHASRCFQASDRKLGCTSCHDPHEPPDPNSRPAYYEAKCQTCHAERGCSLPATQRKADPQRSQCISCHMPRLSAIDVPHTGQTDHRIPRRHKQSPAEVDDAETGPLRIFDLDDSPLSPTELDRAWGMQLSQTAEKNDSAEIAQEAEMRLLRARKAAPDDVDVLDALAAAYVVQGRTGDALAVWRSVLAIDPDRQAALLAAAVALQKEGEFRQASLYLVKLLALNPWQASVHQQHSQVLRSLGKFPEAIAAAQRSLELDPTQIETYIQLRDLHQISGDNVEFQRLETRVRQLRRLRGGRAPAGDRLEQP